MDVIGVIGFEFCVMEDGIGPEDTIPEVEFVEDAATARACAGIGVDVGEGSAWDHMGKRDRPRDGGVAK